MNVTIHGRMVEIASRGDVAILCAGLRPTQREIDAAKAACLRERDETGYLFDDEGRVIGEKEAA